ncbi:MAG: hypothetical protein OEZ58_06635 [Gammaproteobacteria bacterium]|nr:hypothetical protein [Gammaproteobacteria bacterium]
MTNQLTQTEVTQEVISYVNKYGLGNCKEYKEFHSKICSSSKHSIYYGLMGVFEEEVNSNKLRIQTFAGRLLKKINPKCPESPEKAIFRLLTNWDISAEEVIGYLSNRFGRDRIVNIVAIMKTGDLTEHSKSVLTSIEFWVTGK